MTKRYFTRNWGDEYYIFDSEIISEEEFDNKVQYEEYQAFENSMTSTEIVDLLNELNDANQELNKYCRSYHWYKQYKIVLNENAHLKSDLKELHKICKQYEQKLHELKSVINTLQIGISKMMQSIKEDREHHALIVGIEILKKLEEKGFLGEKE